jgi:hypothetical protein
VQAGVTFALWEATGQGHCGLPVDDLVRDAARLLGVPPDLVQDAIARETRQGAVVSQPLEGRPGVFLASLARAEQAVAARLQALATGAPPWPAFAVDAVVTQAEAQLQLTLAPSQRAAVATALTHKLTVITGGPGVGKTTLVRTILTILTAHGVRPLLCAPTGRVAKRLTDSAGHPAQAIHRLLGAQPGQGFQHDEQNPLDAGLVVVDECSMIDVTSPRSKAPLQRTRRRAPAMRGSRSTFDFRFASDYTEFGSVARGDPFLHHDYGRGRRIPLRTSTGQGAMDARTNAIDWGTTDSHLRGGTHKCLPPSPAFLLSRP